MHLLSDEALWQAMQSSLSPTDQERLHELNHLAGERELTEQERREQTDLLETYQRSIVLRSQAIAILKLRGYSIPNPPIQPSNK